MESGPKIPVTYGRACMTCTRSKCKCVPRVDGEGCERCHRLKKACQSSEPIRKRNTQKHDTSRIVQLEGKLDSIVSLLQSVAQPRLGASSPTLHLDAGTRHASPSQPQIQEPFLNAVPSISPPDSSFSGLGTSDLPGTSVHPTGDLHPSEADDCLGLFRTQMLKFFAFLHLPDQLSAKQLQQERPFLFLCIMAVTTRSTENKVAKYREIKQILAQRMILENLGDINLDLLLGLLTFLSWGQDQLLNNTPTSLSRFTSFAMTLVFDLRLNKPPPKDSNMLPTLKPQEILTVTINTTQNLDEQRAVLGCFLLSSIVSSYFGQIDALVWTPYMSECLDALSESEHSRGDKLFAHQVRLQLLSQQVSEVVERTGKANESTTLPPDFYLKPFQAKLDELVGAVSFDVHQDTLFLASMYSAKLSIYAMAVCKAPFTVDSAGLQRLESLYICLNTVKSALDNFFTLPSSAYLGLSFPFFAQFAQYIVILLRLSTFEHPAWDTGFVRSTVDVLVVLDQIISNLQQVHVDGGTEFVDVIRDKTVKILGLVRSWCAVKLAPHHHGGTNSEAIDENSMFTEPMFLEGLDDIWMRDIFQF